MIKCYAMAASRGDAESAAWDLDHTTDAPEYAEKFPERYSPDEMRTYEITITARVMPKRAAKKASERNERP